MAQTFSFPNYGLFNATYYLQQNPDVATSWTGTPLQHYIQFGALEGRAPTAWFNADFYRASYTDLQSMNALQLFNHYCNYGYNEGRVPMLNFSNFNGVRYLLDNPDVAAAGYTAANAISHYVNYGEYEGRAAYATNGVVIDPVVNEGQLFTLTTGVDSIQGTQFNDTFDASQAGTLQNFDSLDGMGGVDTLYATIGYNTTTTTPMQLSNIEVISASTYGTGAATLNLINAGQVTNVNNNASAGGLTFTNIAAGADLAVSNSAANTQFDYASTTGTQTVDLAVNEVTANADITIADVETVNITSSGNVANVVDLIATSATTVTAAGTAALDISGTGGDLSAATLIDGTNMVGALTATLEIAGTINGGLGNDALTGANNVKATLAGNAGNDTLTAGNESSAAHSDSMSGGLGNDTIVFAAGLRANTATAANNDSIDGGLGVDTLSSTSALLAGVDNTVTGAIQSISNIEAITVSDTGGLADNLTLSKIQAGINTVNLTGGVDESKTITFDTLVAATVNLGGDIDTSETLGVTAAGTSAADRLTIANTNTVTGGSAVDVFGDEAITVTGYEAITLGDGVATTTQSLTTLTVNDSDGEAATVFFTGANAFDLASYVTNNTGVQTIDASGLTATSGTVFTYGDGAFGTGATQSIIGSAGNDSIVADNGKSATVLGGAGNDTVTGGTAADLIDGGLGNDSLTGAGGNDTIHGGAGNDTIIETVGGTVSITGGEGNDSIFIGSTLTSGDVIDGGAGTNLLDITTALIANYAPITNIQTLQISASLAQDVSKFTGTNISQVNFVGASTAASISSSVTNVTAEGVTLALLGSADTINSKTATFEIDHAATDTTADSLTIGALTDATTTTVTAFTDADVETLTVGAGLTTDVRAFTISTLNAADLVTLNVVNAGNFTTTLADQSGNTGADVFTTLSAASNNGTVSFDGSAQDVTGQNLTGASAYANTLFGGGGDDVITGGAAADNLVGGDGADTISGVAGNDSITGGLGNDAMDVGTGTDTVIYTAGTATAQTQQGVVATGFVFTGDTITSLANGDAIDLSAVDNLILANGAISVGTTFATGTANTALLVSGSYNTLTGIFTSGAASATNNDYLLQFTGSTGTGDVNNVMLVDIVGTVTAASAAELITLTVA